MYKDRDRQREANREHARAYRSRKKGMTEGMTPAKGMTVIPDGRIGRIELPASLVEVKVRSGRPLVAHSPTCRCLMCRPQ